MMNAVAFESWSRTHGERTQSGTQHLWPSETLVRLFRGRFVPGLDPEFEGKSVLDVGCGDGNNLLLYAALRMRISVTEVTEEICQIVRRRLAAIGCEIDARVGFNRELPFSDDSFDYLVSWNAIHYESNEADIVAAIAEYARVLRPGGRILLSTTGPEHLILKGATKAGPNRYRIAIDDFRKGQTFFYFESASRIHELFDRYFAEVLVGRDRSDLFSRTADFFLVTGIKG